MAHVRGLHETGGLRTLRVAGSTDGRSKLTAKLSRLDHQKSLLERQLAVWTEKQKVTKHRLDVLDNEIAKIARLIREFAGPYRNVNRRNRVRATKPERQSNGDAAASRRSAVNIEY